MKQLPRYALEMLNILQFAGFEAYAVGGCVRDAVMGKTATDIDTTTSAKPEEIQALFPHSFLTGGAYYTVTALHGGGKAEITPFRSEGGYSDSRRPDSVSFASGLPEDLNRRDFTINTLCLDGERIIDLHGGQADIEAKVIRCVGDAERRFNEDALRIMRAFRFAATLGFDIEESTLNAALLCADNLKNISVERIRDELIKTAISPAPERINPLLKSGALGFLRLHASPLLAKVASLPDDTETRFSAFLEVCGRDALDRLKLPTRQKRVIRAVFNLLDCFPAPEKNAVKRAMSTFSAKVFLIAAEIGENVYGKSSEYIALFFEIAERKEPYRVSDLEVNGRDLISAGIPKAEIGDELKRLLESVIDDPEINTKERLLELLKRQ